MKSKDLEFMIEKEKFALFYGIMLGDGCISLVKGKKKFVAITGSLDDDLPFFENIILPILRELRGRDTKIKFRKDCRAIDFNFIDKNLFDLIFSYGFPIGKKGPDIVIPEIFYKEDLMKYIIQGFFATDGSVVLTKNPNKFYPRIEAHVINKKLVRQIYDYLITLGFKGHFYKCKRLEKDPRWKIVQDQYRFQFNGRDNLILFNEKIGFINPKHKKRFLDFIKYHKEYESIMRGIPFQKQGDFRKPINSKFANRMAAPGVEPGTPSS